MADTISICTYNVNGFNDTKVPYLQTVIDDHNIIFIQEHWLFDSQSHIFEDTFSNISAYSVSGMDDGGLIAGRRYGGCAILWQKSLLCSITPVSINNRRVFAIVLKTNELSVLLCNVYNYAIR